VPKKRLYNTLQIAVRPPNRLQEGRTTFFIDRAPGARISGANSHTNWATQQRVMACNSGL
jgi:hypothetical protein